MSDKKSSASPASDRFPMDWLPPSPTQPSFKELGITPLAQQLGLKEWQLNGHWCKRCQGIWYGYTLEAQCPCCGNRDG